MASSRRIIAFINAAHFADHMAMLIFPTAVLAMAPAMGRSFGDMIELALPAFICFGAGSMPAGWIGDRWSRRHMMAVFFLGLGAATVVTGFAQTPLQVACGMALMGVFASIYHPVGTALLVSHAEKVGREIGVNGVFGNLGVAFAALIAGALTDWVGWRWAFFVPGAALVATGVAFCLLVPPEPNLRAGARRHDRYFPMPVLVRVFVAVAVMTLASGLIFNAVSVALPKMFDERLSWVGGSAFGVGVMVSVIYAVGAVAQLVMGQVVDRYPIKTGLLPIAVGIPLFLGAAAFAEGWVLLLVAACMVLVMFGLVTANDATVAKYTVDAWRGRVYAVRYVITFGVSAGAVPLVSFMHEHAGGFLGLFQILAAIGASVLVCALFFPFRPDELTPVPSERPAAAE